MAMRNYGIESKCIALTLNELYNLCITKRVYVNEETSKLFENFYDENNIPLDLSAIDYDNLFDIIYKIDFATYIGECDGSLTTIDDNKTNNFYGEDLVIIELKKYHNLFECYNDYDEIYEEIINDLMCVGIKVDKEYIKEHFGHFEGSYYS